MENLKNNMSAYECGYPSTEILKEMLENVLE